MYYVGITKRLILAKFSPYLPDNIENAHSLDLCQLPQPLASLDNTINGFWL